MSQASEAAGHFQSLNCAPTSSWQWQYPTTRLKKKTVVKDYENGKVVKETVTEEWETSGQSYNPYWYGGTTINTTTTA